MIAALLVMNNILMFDATTTWSSIIMIVANTIVGGCIYLVISYKMGLINEVFGRAYVNKLIKKLTFGKVSLR